MYRTRLDYLLNVWTQGARIPILLLDQTTSSEGEGVLSESAKFLEPSHTIHQTTSTCRNNTRSAKPGLLPTHHEIPQCPHHHSYKLDQVTTPLQPLQPDPRNEQQNDISQNQSTATSLAIVVNASSATSLVTLF